MIIPRTNSGITVVWVDVEHARLIHFSDDRMKREVLRPPDLENIVAGIESAHRVLILGPDAERLKLYEELRQHHPNLATKVIGCDVSDIPSDDQIAGHVSRYFGRLA